MPNSKQGAMSVFSSTSETSAKSSLRFCSCAGRKARIRTRQPDCSSTAPTAHDAMVRTSVTVTVLSCLTIYYLLGLWFHKNDAPLNDLDATLAGGLTPTKKFSQRIVAIGDLHGDLPHALRALRLAGLVDHRNKWIGRRAILGVSLQLQEAASDALKCKGYTVQTGDVLDRGKDTIALYHLFDELRAQARQAGGDVLSLLGNHEYMNALGDWSVHIMAQLPLAGFPPWLMLRCRRYVTDEEIATFHGERNRRKAISGDGQSRCLPMHFGLCSTPGCILQAG